MIHDEISIIEVDVERILGLRTEVLRPHFESGQLARWPEDDKPSTRHFAAVRGDDVVGCVTFQVVPFPYDDKPTSVDLQLRGMAVAEEFRDQGVGAQLLEGALFRLPLLYPDAQRVWCNARERAVPFYERAGFEQAGEFFEKPGIGPHVVMWRAMPMLLA